jgi:hypothetical protein
VLDCSGNCGLAQLGSITILAVVWARLAITAVTCLHPGVPSHGVACGWHLMHCMASPSAVLSQAVCTAH